MSTAFVNVDGVHETIRSQVMTDKREAMSMNMAVALSRAKKRSPDLFKDLPPRRILAVMGWYHREMRLANREKRSLTVTIEDCLRSYSKKVIDKPKQ